MGKTHDELCGISMSKHKNKGKDENRVRIETYDDKLEEVSLLRSKEVPLAVAKCVVVAECVAVKKCIARGVCCRCGMCSRCSGCHC